MSEHARRARARASSRKSLKQAPIIIISGSRVARKLNHAHMRRQNTHTRARPFALHFRAGARVAIMQMGPEPRKCEKKWAVLRARSNTKSPLAARARAHAQLFKQEDEKGARAARRSSRGFIAVIIGPLSRDFSGAARERCDFK